MTSAQVTSANQDIKIWGAIFALRNRLMYGQYREQDQNRLSKFMHYRLNEVAKEYSVTGKAGLQTLRRNPEVAKLLGSGPIAARTAKC